MGLYAPNSSYVRSKVSNYGCTALYLCLLDKSDCHQVDHLPLISGVTHPHKCHQGLQWNLVFTPHSISEQGTTLNRPIQGSQGNVQTHTEQLLQW